MPVLFTLHKFFVDNEEDLENHSRRPVRPTIPIPPRRLSAVKFMLLSNSVKQNPGDGRAQPKASFVFTREDLPTLF